MEPRRYCILIVAATAWVGGIVAERCTGAEEAAPATSAFPPLSPSESPAAAPQPRSDENARTASTALPPSPQDFSQLFVAGEELCPPWWHPQSWLPIVSEPWTTRPLHAGLFSGFLSGDELLDRQVEIRSGFLSGLRVGEEIDEYFGWEARLAISRLDLVNTQGQAVRRYGDFIQGDVNVVYTPISTLRWRPYLSAGLGLATLDFNTHQDLPVTETVLTIPLGVGLAFRYDDWLALRLDFVDTIALGEATDIENMHLLSLVGGAEVRFGGSRTSYYPWNPSRTIW